MALPPEEPTRRLPPTGPPPAGPPPRGPHEPLPPRDPYVDDVEAERHSVLHEVRSLKRWLALLGVLALTALGISLYTLLSDEEDGDGRGASASRVSKLDDRVDQLEERVENRASAGAVKEVRDDQEALSGRVDELEQQPDDEPQQEVDTSGLEETDDQLRQDIEDLEQRLEQAEQDAADSADSP